MSIIENDETIQDDGKHRERTSTREKMILIELQKLRAADYQRRLAEKILRDEIMGLNLPIGYAK
jgi:hypothetical protein